MPSFDEVLEAKEAAVQRLFRPAQMLISSFAATAQPKHNLVGIGVGQKNGEGELCVRFYVDRKLPVSAVGDYMLPTLVNGIVTDVVETGRFRRFAVGAPASIDAAITNRGKVRPVQPGVSCGFRFPAENGMVMAGTLGIIVKDANGQYILSNNHVLADEGQLSVGSPIYQPGLLDGGNVATDLIARLSRFIPLSSTAMNHVDCAIAKIEAQIEIDATFMPQVGKLNSSNTINPVVGMSVMKTGRTTGFTKGNVTDIHATVTVQYETGNFQFDEQVIVTGSEGPFSDSGDSGSLIVDIATKQATALLFAGSSDYTIGNRIDTVLNALHVQLVI